MSWGGDSGKPAKKGGKMAPPPSRSEELSESCPVTALGARDGVYYFFRANGELRGFRARDLLKDYGHEDLFGRRISWLLDNFKNDKGYNMREAGRWLIGQCEDAGLFDPNMPVRGPGVWRDGATLAVHCGDRVMLDGEWRRAGFCNGGALYPLAPSVAPPAEREASAADGRRLVADLGLWRFDDARGPDMVAGFIGQGHLGAAIDWRAHMFVRAQYGSGKTWLCEIVAAAAGARPPSNNVTAASLYQALSGEARALVIDEAEKSERDERIVQVIELVRLMAGGEGARIARGSAGGRARQFTIAGAAFLSAILHPPLKPQDRSRFVIVKLLPLETGRGTAGRADRARAAQARAQKLAPAFRARAIGGWTRFVDTAAAWRAAMIEDGVETRAADTYAAVLAGRDLLCRDDLPGMSEIEGEIAALSDRLVRSSDRRGDGEGEQCLIQLYSSQVESWSAGERETVGELLAKAREPGAARNEINRKLGRAGLRLDFTGGAPVLLVARHHVGLERIFANSRWAGGVWVQALEDLDGAASWGPTHFAGAPSTRCTALPAVWLPPSEGSPADNGPTPEDLGA